MKLTLRAARINKGLKQTEAAELLGVKESTLSRYERGMSFPDVSVLKKIEEVYSVNYNDLIFMPKNYGKTVTKGA